MLGGMERAGFYPRAAALLVDVLAVAAVAHAAVYFDAVLNQSGVLMYFGPISGAGTAAAVLTCAALELGSGGTPGKRVMRLALMSADGQPAPRGDLARRALAKYGALVLTVFPTVLFACTGEEGFRYALPNPVVLGLTVVAVVDAVIAGAAVLLVTAGCFLALRPDRRALHDLASGTGVFHRARPGARGFTPIVPTATAVADDSV